MEILEYTSIDELNRIYDMIGELPDYIADSLEEFLSGYVTLEELVEHKDEVYFYHCPKLTKDNRCSDYENRPQICRDFPDNALSILPKTCGYKGWKEEVEPIALMLHSMVEIIEYYKERLG